MGSKHFDIHGLDLGLLRPWLQGDVPDLVETLYASDTPPDPALRPAFEKMAEHMMIFMPRTRHPEGIVYARAVEYLLGMLGSQRHCIEFYFEGPADSLVFDPCEAPWLCGVLTEYGPGDIRYRTPNTCRMHASTFRNATPDPSIMSEDSLQEAAAALESAWRSGHGAFIIYQE